MLDLLGSEKCARFLHVLKNSVVGNGVVHSRKLSCVLGLITAVVNGNDDINVVTAACLVVVCAKAGSCVNATCTAVHSNVICVNYYALSVKEGVLSGHVLKFLTLKCCKHLVGFNARSLESCLGQRLCKHVNLTALNLYKIVFLNGVERDRKVTGKSPSGSCPDNEICLIKIAYARKLTLVVCYLELYVDRCALVSLILDLRLCESGLILGAPINGLKSLVDVSSLEHLAEHLNLCRLKVGGHCKVGVLPVCNKTKTLELLSLLIYKSEGKLLTCGAELGDRHLLSVKLVLLDDCGLDGHTVVIPSGNVGDLVALHRLVLVDEVLEYLVEGVTHVDVTV